MIFDIPTAYLVAGFLYLIMPISAWLILYRQHSQAVHIWFAGGVMIGVSLLLLGLRNQVPAWASYSLANGLLYLGNMLHVYALRQELDLPRSKILMGFSLLVMLAVHEYFRLIDVNASLRFSWSLLIIASLLGWTGWLAWRIAVLEKSQSAMWMAGVHALTSFIMSIRIVRVQLNLTPSDAVVAGIDSMLTTFTGFMAAVIGSVAIVGIYLERVNKKNLLLMLEQERQKASHQLYSQITQFDRRNSMGELSAALAHELGQPITGILLDCSILKVSANKKSPKDENQIKILQSLSMQAERASQILNGIRNFIKPGSSIFNIVNLLDVVQEVKAMASYSVGNKSFVFVVNSEVLAPQVNGDFVQISQIVLNVFLNAFQARTSDLSPTLLIDVHIHQKDGRLLMMIQDNGPGFPIDVLPNVGASFNTTKSNGMGIGLSISRRIAEQHGGSLTFANSSSGRGAKVILDLPVAANAQNHASMKTELQPFSNT